MKIQYRDNMKKEYGRVTDNKDWPVSETGGEKISGIEAAKILDVAYSTLYNLIGRGQLLRAEPRRKTLRKQPLVFYRADVLALAAADPPPGDPAAA